jgi:hypothetical protein
MARGSELAEAKAVELPELSNDEFAGESGGGLEGTRPEERKPSFLYLLQTTAKAVNRGMAEYVDGAQPGMFYSTGTGRLFDQFEFIPLKRETSYVEWIPVEEGGGFVGTHEPDSEFVRAYIQSDRDRFRKIQTEDGHQLVQTQTIYALGGPPGFTELDEAELVAIPFTSIKIRHYTGWLDAAKRITYPGPSGPVHPNIYRHRWLLASEFEQKWKPNGAWNVRVKLVGGRKELALVKMSDPLYSVLKEMYEGRDEIKADYSSERDPGEPGEDIPF